jgi:hypothetical protein
MIEVKTSDLAGPALDWAIAQIEGVEVAIAAPQYGTGWRVYKPNFGGKYSPSTDWAVGGPLIDKYKLDLGAPMEADRFTTWSANTEWGHPHGHKGETALIAACRAIVAAKLGNTVQVPAELLTPTLE